MAVAANGDPRELHDRQQQKKIKATNQQIAHYTQPPRTPNTRPFLSESLRFPLTQTERLLLFNEEYYHIDDLAATAKGIDPRLLQLRPLGDLRSARRANRARSLPLRGRHTRTHTCRESARPFSRACSRSPLSSLSLSLSLSLFCLSPSPSLSLSLSLSLSSLSLIMTYTTACIKILSPCLDTACTRCAERRLAACQYNTIQ